MSGRRPAPRTNIADPSLTVMQKADKFAASLRRDIEPFHDYSACLAAPPRVPPVLLSLRRRELGHTRNPEPHTQIYRAMLVSDSREFRPAELIKLKGSADYQNRQVVHAKTRAMFSFDTLTTFIMEGLMSTEKIVATLYSPGDYPVPDSNGPPTWLLVLTDLGRFMVYDVISGERKYTYQLPAHTHKFKKLSWNKDNEEISIYGYTIPQHIDEAASDATSRQSFCDKRVVLAVFNLFPMRFKAMFELDKKLFANVYSAVLDDDIIMAFCSSPHRVVMFSFDQIYKEFCTQPDVEEVDLYSTGEKILPFNMLIDREPRRIIDIKGNFSSIFFGGSNFILLEPASARETYSLRYMKNVNAGPRLEDLEMHGTSGGCSFTVELSSAMISHPDSSMRILRWEGIHLACYNVESVLDGSGEYAVRASWRTALMPGRRCSTDGIWPRNDVTRSGRVSRPTDGGYRNEGDMNATTVRILEMNYCYADVLTITVTYDVSNLGSSSNSIADPESDWVTLVFLLDSVTGRILRIVPVRIYAGEVELETGNFRQSAELDDDLIACSSYDGKISCIETYRLIEPAQRKWVEDKRKVPITPFVPTALNRKERRRRRARSRQQHRDGPEESDSDWRPPTTSDRPPTTSTRPPRS